MNNLQLTRNIALKLVGLAVILGAILRVCLIFNPLTVLSGASVGTIAWVFVGGALNDIFTTIVLLLPLWAFAVSAGTWRFGRPQGYVFLAIMILAWIVLQLFPGALAEFNAPLYRITGYVLIYWIAIFALRMFVPRMRRGWMCAWMSALLVVYVGLLVFNFIGEWLFWDEFGVRYNFIAVDYLIYTTEVVGNIFESYPMWWIIAAIVVLSLGISWLLFRRDMPRCATLDTGTWRVKASAVYIAALIVSVVALPQMAKLQTSRNVYVNELQASGPYSFYNAFFSNELNFNSFYITVSPDQLESYTQNVLSAPVVPDSMPEIRPNIILVTMESMSADYMARFGGQKSLTPALDSLYNESLAFNRMFAAGNRTVRGLEAVTLSRPPSPGESIIKRKDNTGYPSIADVLREKGYSIAYVYGGDSYFDNMESFFGGNGYEIIDNGNFAPSEVNFKTVWGVCDGDVYDKVLKEADNRAKSDRPFFMHMMTTSNHRPYTYPEGKISIPPTEKRRDGGVMYSDYALGDFIEKAKEHKWFDNTVFVIVADHCASSAGSVDLPLENYHIPALIYAPALVKPAQVDKTVSQIDLMPTLFSLLGWHYTTPLYGKNALDSDFTERAFIATYQDMGYLQGDTLTVISPGKKSRQFVIEPTEDNPFALRSLPAIDERAKSRAVAMYQKSTSSK